MGSSPANAFSNVVFPAPLWPKRPTISGLSKRIVSGARENLLPLETIRSSNSSRVSIYSPYHIIQQESSNVGYYDDPAEDSQSDHPSRVPSVINMFVDISPCKQTSIAV